MSFVAKSVPRKDWNKTKGMREAIDKEWAKLRAADHGHGTWDETKVRSFYDVRKEAREKEAATGEHADFGFVRHRGG